LQIFSYGYVYRIVALLDYFVSNYNQTKAMLISSFDVECITKIKGLIDYIEGDMARLKIIDPIKNDVSERVLKMLINYRQKTMSMSSTGGLYGGEEAPAI
jgi:hypothetical protein